MTATTNDAARIARQHLETLHLLGVPVIPRPVPADGSRSAARGDDAAGAASAVATARSSADASSAPAATPSGDPAAALAALEERYRREVADVFDAHDFTKPVFGEGSPTAALMFVGEGPGADEDRTGRPFVGRAGEKLDQMITAMGLERGDVYIANVVKIRPPGNRTPEPAEVARCSPFLREQIRIVRPGAIVALGGPATRFLLDTDTGITRLRGRWSTYRDPEVAGLEVPVMPTYHPAFVLRRPTPEVRRAVWGDLQQAMARLGLGARGA